MRAVANPSPRLPPVTMTFCIGHYRPRRNGAASGSGSATLGRVDPTPSNPCRLSAALAGLFAAGAVAAELRGPGDPALLLPPEGRVIGQAVPKRRREFA